MPAKLQQILPQIGHCWPLWLTWMLRCGAASWTCLFIWLLRPASEKQFSQYGTFNMVTLWTWCRSLFIVTNWSFLSSTLNTAVLKRFYAHINQFTPLTSIQCNFFHRSTDMLNCLRQLFTESLNFFFGFDAFLKQLL